MNRVLQPRPLVVLGLRGTSPMRKRPPLGPCTCTVVLGLGTYGGPRGGGHFLMSEVPPYTNPELEDLRVTPVVFEYTWRRRACVGIWVVERRLRAGSSGERREKGRVKGLSKSLRNRAERSRVIFVFV